MALRLELNATATIRHSAARTEPRDCFQYDTSILFSINYFTALSYASLQTEQDPCNKLSIPKVTSYTSHSSKIFAVTDVMRLLKILKRRRRTSSSSSVYSNIVSTYHMSEQSALRHRGKIFYLPSCVYDRMSIERTLLKSTPVSCSTGILSFARNSPARHLHKRAADLLYILKPLSYGIKLEPPP